MTEIRTGSFADFTAAVAAAVSGSRVVTLFSSREDGSYIAVVEEEEEPV